MPNYLRAYCERSEGEPGTPIRFTASTEGIKRDGKALKAEDWALENFKRNPVVLWVHDYMGRNLPIGRADASVESNQLLADVMFDQQDEFARQVESKYRRGFLNAVSVGWDDVQLSGGQQVRHELLDISAVPVPGDPDALIQRQYRALKAMVEEEETFRFAQDDKHRGAIPPHTTAKAPEDAGWDGPGEVAKAPAEAAALRKMFAWVDDQADPNTKQAYKLPHHMAEGEVVWRGAAAAMARLLQAGTQIPDTDRRGVYNHLARHYQQFDKEPPEFRTNADLEALSADEIRGLFLEDEPELFPGLFGEARVGAVLNARNRERLVQIKTLAQEVLDSAEKTPDDSGDGRQMDPAEKAKMQQCLDLCHQCLTICNTCAQAAKAGDTQKCIDLMAKCTDMMQKCVSLMASMTGGQASGGEGGALELLAGLDTRMKTFPWSVSTPKGQ